MISRISKLLSASAFMAVLCTSSAFPLLAMTPDEQKFLIHIACLVTALLISLAVHECAHAWVADYCGDPTARMLGRVTLNPIKHLDFFWSFLMPLSLLFSSGGSMMFGGGKPVPVNVFNLKYFQRDQLMVAMAGPLSNVLLGALFLVTARLYLETGGKTTDVNFYFLLTAVRLNYVLAIFNSLPIPPLDGFSIPIYFADYNTAARLTLMKEFGIIPLIILLATGLVGVIFQFFDVYYLMILKYSLPGVGFATQ